MYQGVVNFNPNFGQCYTPNGQPIYIIPQSNQVGHNPIFNQFHNYYPLGQPCIAPQVPIYMPQQIMYQSKEDSQIKTFNYQIPSENKGDDPKFKYYSQQIPHFSRMRHVSQSCDDESREFIRGTSNKMSKQSTSQCLQYQKQETSFSDNQYVLASNKQRSASSQKRTSDYQFENEYFQYPQGNCKNEGLTCESVIVKRQYIESHSNNRNTYSKVECFTRKSQAGYRIEKQGERIRRIDIIQTISSSRNYSTSQNQGNQFNQMQMEEMSNNTCSSQESPFTQFKEDQRKASNFNQGNTHSSQKKKELKNLEKYSSKQQKNYMPNDRDQSKQLGYSQKGNSQIPEISKTQQKRAHEELTNESKETNHKCIYNLIEKFRKELKKENENEIGVLLIERLTELSQFKSEDKKDVTSVSNVSEESETFQREIAQRQQQQQQQQSLVKQEFNVNNNNIESSNNLFYHQQIYSNLLANAPIQYSDFIIQLKGKISSEDDQPNNLLSKLQNKALTLQSNLKIKEASQYFQGKKEKNSSFFETSNNLLNQFSGKSKRQHCQQEGSESIIKAIILCQSLMETTQTHQTIYNMINQGKYHPIDDKNSNFLTLHNLQSDGQIPTNFPHLSKSVESINNNQKNQKIPVNCDQTNGSSTASASSSEKIVLPQAVEAHKQQQYEEDISVIQFTVKNPSLFEKFDFSQVRQITQKYRSARQQKQNTTYKANSKYHNMNKLLMYNIMSMFQIENLMNFTLDDSIREHLAQIIKVLKLLSKRTSEKYKFEYFSREHYHILFLKITSSNIEFLATSEKDRYLHEKCYNIDFSKEISPVELNYVNIMKKLYFQIFMVSIQHDTIIDDNSSSKQNLRRQYCLKAISGIKKLSIGEVLVRF